MAFPEDILNIKVEFALNGTWTDVTEYVYKDRIEIERGSADESSYSQPTRATFLLNNVDGRFSPRNPNGPHYGHLKRNTPVLISVQDGDNFLDVPRVGRAGSADVTTPTGDLDIQIELQANNWSDWRRDGGDQTVELVGQMEISAGGWMLATVNDRLSFLWINSWPTLITTSSTPLTFPPSGRTALRCTVDVSTGETVYYQADSIDGEWSVVSTDSAGGAITWAANSAPLAVGDVMESSGWSTFSGKIFRVRVADSIGGQPIVDVDFSQVTKAAAAFTDLAGADWIVEDGAHVNNQWNRFKGEVTAWPTTWTTGGHDAWVRTQAQTLLRRHTQGNRSLKSTLARRIPSHPDVVAYWPMEEPDGATQFYSPLPNIRPMSLNSEVSPGGHVGPHGSEDLPSMSTGANWQGLVRIGSATGWAVETVVNPQQLSATHRILWRVQTSGTIRVWRVAASNAAVRVLGLDRDGVIAIDEAFALASGDWLNQWSRMILGVVQDGSDIDWKLRMVPIGGSGFSMTHTDANQTCGRVLAVGGPDSGDIHEDISGMSLGHMTVFNTDNVDLDFDPFNFADHGYTGEIAYDRMARVVDEEGERVVINGRRLDTVDMGAQRPDRFIDLLRECATADAGIFTDNRDVADWEAFKFIPRTALENQQPVMTLDYEGSDGLVTPMDPTDDDLYLRNSVTMNRERGSSFYVELAEGPNSIDEVGEYPGGEAVNLERDSQLPSRAGWELHLGTWDEERYPSLTLKLQAAPHMIPDWLKVEQGSVIRVVNARNADRRTFVPPGDLNLMVRGYREHLAQFEWEVELQCVPAGPYDVAVLEKLSNRTQWLDTEASGLTVALDADDTDIVITTTAGPAWTDDLEDYPLDLIVGGEAIRALAPGRLLTPNPLTSENVTGWSGNNLAVSFSQERVHPDPAAEGSIKVVPNGSSASGDTRSSLSGAGTVQEGDRLTAGVWVYAVEGLAQFRPTVNWYTSAGAYVSTETGSTEAIPAHVWTWVERTLDAPATASQLAMVNVHSGTPASTAVYYLWAPRVTPVKAAYSFDSFGRTLASSWGNDEQGNTWTNTGGAASDYSVGSGYGVHTLTSVNVSRRSLIDLPSSAATFDVYADVAVSATATGASLYGGPVARYTDNDNMYQLRIVFTTSGATQLELIERVASVQTALDSKTAMLPDYSAGSFLRVRFQGSGTVLRGRIWDPAVMREPQHWHVTADDSSLTTGDTGFRSLSGTGNTNVNVQVRYDNFEVRTPQRMAVERSVNAVEKSHGIASAVQVRYPVRLAM